jgi:hypothetical protein
MQPLSLSRGDTKAIPPASVLSRHLLCREKKRIEARSAAESPGFELAATWVMGG